jgi:hypothetical protein
MQPLSPRMRAALKAEYPGLTDAIIDEVDALLAYRAALNPERAAAAESRREALIAEHMPRYAEIVRRARPGTAGSDWPSVGREEGPTDPARPPAPRRDRKGRGAR